MSEQSYGSDAMGLRVGVPFGEGAREHGYLIVRKWDGDQVRWASKRLGHEPPGRSGYVDLTPADFRRLNLAPSEITEAQSSNVIMQAGWQRLIEKGTGNAAQGYDATHTRIGVGTATAATATNQTDLSAATGTANRWFNLVGTAFATAAGTGTLRWTCAATFASGEANFTNPWQEWCLDQGSASGTTVVAPMLNRSVSNLGTKTSPAVWTATAQLDFS